MRGIILPGEQQLIENTNRCEILTHGICTPDSRHETRSIRVGLPIEAT